MKKLLIQVLILTLLFQAFMIPEVQAVTSPKEKDIPYDSKYQIANRPIGKFSKEKSMSANINETAPKDEKISYIEFFYPDGEIAKTVTVNKDSYKQAVTLNGKVQKVKATRNDLDDINDPARKAFGGWFAWQRCGACATWQEGDGGSYTKISKNPSTPKETVAGVTRDATPGWILSFQNEYTRRASYRMINDESVQIPDFAVADDTSTLNALNPFIIGSAGVQILPDEPVDHPIIGFGDNTTSHRSTKLTGFKVTSINTATVSFTQDHSVAGYGEALGVPGAKMMYFFYNFMFTMYTNTYQYPVRMKIYYDGDPPPPPLTGDVKCTAPSPGKTVAGKQLSPTPTGSIHADGVFDVLQGIPTSETLNARALSLNYLQEHSFVNMTGTCTFNIAVSKTFNLEWEEEAEDPEEPPNPASDDELVQELITIERKYSYWIIDKLSVYEIDKATLVNYALPGGTVDLYPNGYSPPVVNSDHSDKIDSHVYPPQLKLEIVLPSETLSGGTSRPSVPPQSSIFKSEAENFVPKLQVQNDSLVFNGQTIMSSVRSTETGPTPSAVPSPTTIGQNVLYQNALLISSDKLNKSNSSSTGTIFYKITDGSVKAGSNEMDFPIGGLNTVTVHTPTVIYSNASDDATHNQKTNPNSSRRAFILDRPFTVTMPTSGQHLNIPGYGNRDYAKYIDVKQVRFEFDVYSSNKSTFYPANTWIDIPVSQITTAFYLPKWINEGDYTVYYRSFAENSPSSGFTTEQDANLNLANYVATDTVPVEVIGRLFDFKITDIADPNWETVFRTSKGSSTSKGASYWVGTKGIDGATNGSVHPYQLPIRRGSHPLSNFKNITVKTGYHFKFDLKTMGNMFGDKDAVRITPKFYYQDNNASTPVKRVEVDLYYHSDNKKFIKIGSTADVERREIILNNRLRNVPYSDIVNTAGSNYDMNTGRSMTRDQYLNAFVKRSKEPTYVGGYDVQLLPSPLRTFINTFDRPSNANATPARVNASVQQWYGEYSLPAAVYAVPKGTDLAAYGKSNRLDEKSPIFLKNGYITVNFNIETIRNANLSSPHLQYIYGPLNNQWWDMEGYDGSDGTRDHVITDPYGVKFLLQDGDVVFYDTNLSSYDDYVPSGTH